VAHLEQENTNLSLVLQTMLSKFDQILGAISDNVSQTKQPKKSKQKPSHPEESEHPHTVLDTSFEEPDPVKEAMANLEKETKSLSQVLRVMLTKQEQNDSSLENLGLQISQLQEEKKEIKNKGGFWNKWIT
jgi:chromosome segregation ATPase